MKRLRSSDDLHSYGDKAVVKDWARKEDSGLQRSSSSLHRSSHYNRPSDSGRKVLNSSTSRYDRSEDDRESPKMVRKRSDYDLENYDRRKPYDRYRAGGERGVLTPPPRATYGPDQMYRSESFSGPPRRDFPKGFRSERDRPKRDGIATSWRRFGGSKDSDDGSRSGNETSRGSRMESKEVENSKSKSPRGFRDAKSPGWSKDSESERSKSVEGKKYEDMPPVESGGPSSEREEGELEPDPQPHMHLAEPDVEDNNSSQKEVNDELRVEINTVEKDVEDDMNKSRGDENDTNDENEGENNLTEDADSNCADKLSVQEQSEEKEMIIEKESDDNIVTDNVEITAMEKTTPSLKDKGKSVALSPSDSVHYTETDLEPENKRWALATSGDFEIEGPSTRGFQFFSTDPVKKPENVEQLNHNNNKPKDDKLALELSLSLPNVLLPIGSQNRAQAPGSPSRARSVQSFASSFRTNSDGFTASMSFSGSQQFTHNPSCSLTHNALDFEQSVKSKPLFQGVDWKALASEENKNKEVPPQQSQPNPRVTGGGGSSKLPIALERQLSFNNKHLSGAKSFGSYENGLEEPVTAGGVEFAESIVTMIVSEPLQAMARRFSDMSGKHRACVKEFVLDIISNPGKQWQMSALQKALQKRADITLDMLLNAHRIQLEILVALKTGLREYLLQKHDFPSSDLAEVFLNMRCRNMNCRSVLPVDECDCKICSRRSDFCRECMCLVCSKFDMASNTCSWVGCDVCLHWCHADCGLRESHIRNGQSATGPRGATEMQFYCVACGHPSEMFGFVKEVFQNFVKEWTAENLCRELEYVRRIFGASEDIRGKQLHEISVKMLSKLGNGADLQGAQNHIMRFFNETNLDRPVNVDTSIEPRKELPTKNQERINGIGGSSLGAGWLKPVYPDKPPHLENPVKLLPDFDGNRNENKFSDFQKSVPKEQHVFDELESIVRIKQAEAKMFQSRAEDARKESEALRRIAVTKSERIEEEYMSRIAKLRLAEAEDMRKQKVEELQALERAYQEYFNMKMRMETDIKDLLLKMEATRRNLAK
ncbi:protein oberon 4 [Phtheirospermum japonicum]|uniref:Protein oberon 4 n=1 Tax=Phtheirospermum japonicum TaxID=374723 RepID=A0A830BXB9_9LAMI|nr:protein oberon 4 [Phtheirospermum japonicum]